MIEDEQLPALAVGDETGCVGLRVDAREVVSARGADAIAALDDPGDDTVASAATGVVRSTVDDYNGFTDVAAVEFVLDFGNLLARVPRGARQPQAGERVTARGRLTVIPPHEFDDFALPDVRSAMRIDAIQG